MNKKNQYGDNNRNQNNNRRSSNKHRNRDKKYYENNLPAYEKQTINTEAIKGWIASGICSKTDEFAYHFGYELATQKLTKSQIRNIFGEVKRLDMKMRGGSLNESIRTDVLLLRSKFAYTVRKLKKNNRVGFKPEENSFDEMLERYQDVVWAAHEAVKGNDDEFKQRYKRFAQFFEAVLAYHKVHGGSDK